MAEYRGVTVADMTKLRTEARGNGVVSPERVEEHAGPSRRRRQQFRSRRRPDDRSADLRLFRDGCCRCQMIRETNDKLVIRGGVQAGGKALDANAVKQLASIPSRKCCWLSWCGLLMSPIPAPPWCWARWRRKGEGDGCRRLRCATFIRSNPNCFR